MHIHLPYLIFPWSFNEIRLVVSENSRGHEQYPIYSCRTHQRAITLGKIIEPEHAGDMRIHLWYLIFPWSFIEIRQAVSENLRGQERDGRTDARTKRRLYAPPKFFGEHKKKDVCFIVSFRFTLFRNRHNSNFLVCFILFHRFSTISYSFHLLRNRNGLIIKKRWMFHRFILFTLFRNELILNFLVCYILFQSFSYIS